MPDESISRSAPTDRPLTGGGSGEGRAAGGGSAGSAELAGLDDVVAVVDGLARAFHDAGHRLYLVGGVVRDLVLGAFSDGDDIDLTTDAGPERIKELIRPLATALWTQGERFGTIGATVAGRDLEVTTHRAEVYDRRSRNPDVRFGTSLDEDLGRRDFTVNAMAISVPDGRLVDPFGGRRDLEGGRLRTPLRAEASFNDDPLRMLRAARFLARFDLEPSHDVVTAATELAPRLDIVSVERIHDELERLLAVADPARGFGFLQVTGLLTVALPGLEDRDGARRSACWMASAPGSVLVRRAGLLSPLGPRQASLALSRLRYARATARRTLALLDTVDRVLVDEVTDEAVRRVVHRIGPADTGELIALARNLADRPWVPAASHDGPVPPQPFADRLAALARREDLSDLEPPLSGHEVMARLDLRPGPEVGVVMGELRERRLVHGPFGRDEALSWLDLRATGKIS